MPGRKKRQKDRNEKRALGLCVRGDELYDAGDCPAALAEYERERKLAPMLAVAYYACASAKMHCEDYDGSLADLDRLTELSSENFASRQVRSFILLALGNERGALDFMCSSLGHYRLGGDVTTWFEQLYLRAGPQSARQESAHSPQPCAACKCLSATAMGKQDADGHKAF